MIALLLKVLESGHFDARNALLPLPGVHIKQVFCKHDAVWFPKLVQRSQGVGPQALWPARYQTHIGVRL